MVVEQCKCQDNETTLRDLARILKKWHNPSEGLLVEKQSLDVFMGLSFRDSFSKNPEGAIARCASEWRPY